MVMATGDETAQSLLEIARQQFYLKGEKFPFDTKETLSVTDNRTGRYYELNVNDDSVAAAAIAKIKSGRGLALQLVDPTLAQTVFYRSSLVQFDATDCAIQGYDYASLQTQSMLQISNLLLGGDLKSEDQLTILGVQMKTKKLEFVTTGESN